MKLCINVVAAVVLVLYTQTLSALAEEARSPATGTAHEVAGLSPLIHGAGALVLLVVATVLSVYKPRGLTRHGQRKDRRSTEMPASQPNAPEAQAPARGANMMIATPRRHTAAPMRS